MDSVRIDRDSLPVSFPTHCHPPRFWEQLGRTIATFGFLEEVLGRAIFAFTATREYDAHEIEAAFGAWLPILEKALTDSLCDLADAYAKSVRENQGLRIQDVEELVVSIKETAAVRNALCHGSRAMLSTRLRRRAGSFQGAAVARRKNYGVTTIRNCQKE